MKDTYLRYSSLHTFQRRYAIAFAVVWTVVIAGAVIWHLKEYQNNTLEIARNQATDSFEKDLVYRRWAAEHGGVYVTPTENTPPNPYLSHVENRDVTTTSGLKLTLMNPAYMTRQVQELGREQYGHLGHITSLKPIRPENAADSWETEALLAFERGEEEVVSIEFIGDTEYLRLMRPMITEENCLKCHAVQGYQVGDLRGGISVSVPMTRLRTIARSQTVVVVLGYGLVWLMGLCGIGAWARSIASRIREQDKAEQQQLALESHLWQSQQLASIGTLAGGMAHEINNPITGIMNYAQLIQDRIDEDSPLKEFSSEIIVETKRVAGIVRTLLAFADQEKQQHSPARLADIVEDTVMLMRAMTDRDRIILEVDVPEDLPKFKCQNQQIQRALMNLLTNACEALNERYPEYDEKKILRITAHSFEKEGRNWIRTTVADYGIGIAPEIIERIFEPFFTTKDRAFSSGLGLVASYSIVRDHYGNLAVESEPGEYTRFHLDLPVDNGWELDKDTLKQLEGKK
jgi:signal transduction histidine kinase